MRRWPIRAIRRIWADGNLLRGTSGTFQERCTFRWYDGNEDQAVEQLDHPYFEVRAIAVRHAPLMRPNSIAPVGTVFFPSPNYIAESWRRAPYGTGAWALCGITHTTSTHAVMQGFFDLRAAPVQPWDAVICTSRSVHASVSYQMDLIDEHLRAHLRAVPPPRPMLPVIPLGIHAADFESDAAAGAGLFKVPRVL